MNDLITIAPPDPAFPPELLDSPGGFVWWYADLLDADRNGLVLIWSFGLPFLPGYTRNHRRGRSELPRERPSLNVAVYEEGELAFYLLQEVPEKNAVWLDSSWTFGESYIEESENGGRRSLKIDLNCPIPGTYDRLRGSVMIDGPGRLRSEEDSIDGIHDWAPLFGPAEGTWELQAGDERYGGQGRAYHDCNSGRGSLEDAGIFEWTWGRLPFPGREVIYYIAWHEEDETPEAIGLDIDSEGGTQRISLDVDIPGWTRTAAGMRYPEEIRMRLGDTPWLHVKPGRPVDHGPFYLRYFIDGVQEGAPATGFGEICRPGRIDLARHRPLVRMRVHQVGGENSIWLPLFSGPREGRLRRLVGQLGGRR